MKNITGDELDFLRKLKKNNNRVWFKENKPWFDRVYADVKSFFGEVYHEMSKTDSFEKFQVYRIYADLRFSKDKTPYRTHYRLYLKRSFVSWESVIRGYFRVVYPSDSGCSKLR